MCKLLEKLSANPFSFYSNDYSLEASSCEIYDKDGKIVAGDIGYKIGSIYISMSGFSSRKIPSLGIL